MITFGQELKKLKKLKGKNLSFLFIFLLLLL